MSRQGVQGCATRGTWSRCARTGMPAPARPQGRPDVDQQLDADAQTVLAAGRRARDVTIDETFEEFYRRTFQGMIRLARALVDDTEDAVEVVQEAFARMLPRFDRIDPDSAEAYLRSTVMNGCRRFLRRRLLSLRHRSRPLGHAQLDTDHVLDAIRRLPPQQRDVVLLRFYLDLSEAEIARTLDIAPGTVKSRLHRALLVLRESLG